ncbi:glutaminyl-peptide cyclotransferase [Lentzea sp. NEAU-D7]|uniref:glutaminyl-peptide cyclotransferase n=1 Tax=Lentzea sp. NEAU-D7 TaxID=2994667 RepID=UPI00224A5E4C|nr:glutaminyl-peptide cyclotransferase [Lentzea sp. NEAU-D7]MCX2946885.1 glutaminyl-peptide cyclotransferase [Lentzea sp. NEAU-D7]
MKPLRVNRFLHPLSAALLTLAACSAPDRTAQDSPAPATTASPAPAALRAPSRHFRAQVLARVPTDRADARGLELVGDLLVENTGPMIRVVAPATGEIRVQRPVSPGSGTALTPAGLWHTGTEAAVVLDPRSLAERRRTAIIGESWGLCYDGTHLVQSDGTARLLLRDRDTGALVRELRLGAREWSTARLGELHCVSVDSHPQVWAAVTGTDWMIRVDLASGAVTADADLTAVTVAELPTGRDQVIGGIAAVPDTAGELWLTGRHYHHRYRVGLKAR